MIITNITDLLAHAPATRLARASSRRQRRATRAGCGRPGCPLHLRNIADQSMHLLSRTSSLPIPNALDRRRPMGLCHERQKLIFYGKTTRKWYRAVARTWTLDAKQIEEFILDEGFLLGQRDYFAQFDADKAGGWEIDKQSCPDPSEMTLEQLTGLTAVEASGMKWSHIKAHQDQREQCVEPPPSARLVTPTPMTPLYRPKPPEPSKIGSDGERFVIWENLPRGQRRRTFVEWDLSLRAEVAAIRRGIPEDARRENAILTRLATNKYMTVVWRQLTRRGAKPDSFYYDLQAPLWARGISRKGDPRQFALIAILWTAYTFASRRICGMTKEDARRTTPPELRNRIPRSSPFLFKYKPADPEARSMSIAMVLLLREVTGSPCPGLARIIASVALGTTAPLIDPQTVLKAPRSRGSASSQASTTKSHAKNSTAAQLHL